ncbi:MAG: crosslink repair DNA glycosylase YcaQ family protein [Clostridia bacterium]|nr:crosslink repair DNA glycosylase YcaQ family protein [Clostridia bacterium]
MDGVALTREQARHFMLLKQGLIGDRKFEGKQGVCDFIRQAGCIQYDPIDVCGKNAALVLQSRVSGFTGEMLDELLYEDRRLIDYFDKNMSIFCVEDWKYFSRSREKHRLSGQSRDQVDSVADEVMRTIRENGFACSHDLQMKETVNWSWSPTTLSRAALETLYFRGDLIIHHKKGAVKYYAPAQDYLSPAILNAPDPNPTDDDFMKWRLLRRIGAIGLLWCRPSDAWLGIEGLKSEDRRRIFTALLSEQRIIACSVEGVADKLYFLREDEPLMQTALSVPCFKSRVEFIAPLDNLMWDRKLIRTLFGFDFKWEIYTPVSQRKYGYYVLPVLFGSRFAGRIELAADRRAGRLHMRGFWKEAGAELGPGFDNELQSRLLDFARFHHCEMADGAWAPPA